MAGLFASAESRMRMPIGDHRVGSAFKMRKLGQDFVALALQRVDPEIERRSACKRGPLRGAFVAEDARKMRVEPFG